MAPKIPKIPVKCMPMRIYISIICSTGLILSYMLRFCISLCILQMVKTHKHPKLSSDCFKNSSVNHHHTVAGTGYFADMVGSVPITVGGMLTTSVVSLVTPEVARLSGWVGLVVLRLILGAGQALAFIPLHSIVNAWIPKKERGTWGSIIFSGVHIGSCINMIVTGQLLKVVLWHWVFRLYGVMGLLWAALFFFTCCSYPDQCDCLSENERKLLEENGLMKRQRHPKPPWLKILTNVPLWSANAATFGHGWVLFSLLTELPKFLQSVMHVTMETNSLINAGMYILIWINAIGSGPVVDLIQRKKWVSLTWNRKIFMTISSMGPALGLVLSVYTNCNVAMAVAVLLSGCSLMGYFYASGKLIGIDMSPHYSATVSSIVNAIGTSAGFIATNVTSQITSDGALVEWRVVMCVAAAIMFITNLVYLVWGSSEVQPFDGSASVEESPERVERDNEQKLQRNEEKE